MALPALHRGGTSGLRLPSPGRAWSPGRLWPLLSPSKPPARLLESSLWVSPPLVARLQMPGRLIQHSTRRDALSADIRSKAAPPTSDFAHPVDSMSLQPLLTKSNPRRGPRARRAPRSGNGRPPSARPMVYDPSDSSKTPGHHWIFNLTITLTLEPIPIIINATRKRREKQVAHTPVQGQSTGA